MLKTLNVIVRCTISGNFSNSVVVGSGNGTSTPEEPTIPGNSGLIIVVVISVIALISLNYKRIRKLRD